MDWTIAAPRLKVSVMRDAGYLPSVNNLRPHLLTGATKGLLSALPVPCIKCLHQCRWQCLQLLPLAAAASLVKRSRIRTASRLLNFSTMLSRALRNLRSIFNKVFPSLRVRQMSITIHKNQKERIGLLSSINAYDFTFFFCWQNSRSASNHKRHRLNFQSIIKRKTAGSIWKQDKRKARIILVFALFQARARKFLVFAATFQLSQRAFSPPFPVDRWSNFWRERR